jgi:hypothetical protein
MDPAIIGEMRVGYFRIGVFTDEFERLMERLKNANPPRDLDAARWGEARWGYFRWGVRAEGFEVIKNKLEASG